MNAGLGMYNCCELKFSTKKFVEFYDHSPLLQLCSKTLHVFRFPAVACTYFDPPMYGVRACNKQTMDSNGVIYEMVCVVQCKEGYAFADQATPNTYMCQSDGTWNKLLHGVALVPVLPKSERPWPDCAREYWH